MRSLLPTKLSGNAAEDLACDYLKQQGLKLVERNYSCRRGEIDLIMRENDALLFIEVRYRNNSRHGSPAESVDARKQSRLTIAAQHYLQQHPKGNALPCRFDVVGITPGPGSTQTIQWIKNAFHA